MKLARTAVALAALGLVFTLGLAQAADRAKAEKDLKAALAAGSAEGTQAACDALIEVGGKEAINVILALAPKVEGIVYWQLVGRRVRVSGRAGSRRAREVRRRAPGDAKSSLSRDLVFGCRTTTRARSRPPS